MKNRYCALILGIMFLVIGVAGFIPALVSMPPGAAPNIPLDAPSVVFDDQYGYLFGLFPVNFLHNVVHIMVGILGIAGYTSFSTARLFNRIFASSYIAIALMGLFPYTNTAFGLMPIYGHNVWLNALTGIIAAYFGFVKPEEEEKNIETSPSL